MDPDFLHQQSCEVHPGLHLLRYAAGFPAVYNFNFNIPTIEFHSDVIVPFFPAYFFREANLAPSQGSSLLQIGFVPPIG